MTKKPHLHTKPHPFPVHSTVNESDSCCSCSKALAFLPNHSLPALALAEHNSENNFAAEKSKFDESKIGNEKEKLLKGLEVLKQTQQWFSHRLGQLELEGGRKGKVRNGKIAFVSRYVIS